MTDGRRAVRESLDTGALYETLRQRFVSTVGALTVAELKMRVFATPAWSVHDVLGHVVALVTNLNAQHFPDSDDVGGVLWAERQVTESRGVAVSTLVESWDREAPAFEIGLRAFGYEMGCHFIADLHAHHQDIRGTLGLPRDMDSLTVAVSLDHYLNFINDMLMTSMWGTLDVVAGGELRRLGVDGRHRASVTGSAFEVLRTFSARRSAGQIRELEWSGDVGSLVAELSSGFSGGYSMPRLASNE